MGIISNLKAKICERIGDSLLFCEPPKKKLPCEQFENNNRMAADLCRLLDESGTSFGNVDTGLSKIVFAPQLWSSNPNGITEAQEIYQASIKKMTDDYFHLDEISPEQEKELFLYKAWQTGFIIPWFIYDGNTTTTIDADDRSELQEKIVRLKRSRVWATQRDFAQAIAEMAFSKEGLNLQVFDQLPEELDVKHTLSTGLGDCTEISRALYLMYSYAGFSPKFVWVRKDTDGNPILHMAIEIEVDGQKIIVDSHYGFDAKYSDVDVFDMPLLTGLSVYMDSLGSLEPDDKKAIDIFLKSRTYDPTFFITYIYLSLDRFAEETERFAEETPICWNYYLIKAAALDFESDIYAQLFTTSFTNSFGK